PAASTPRSTAARRTDAPPTAPERTPEGRPSRPGRPAFSHAPPQSTTRGGRGMGSGGGTAGGRSRSTRPSTPLTNRGDSSVDSAFPSSTPPSTPPGPGPP